jgi:Glycosyl transferase family 2
MMILLTGFYQDADINRQGEFLECLRRNAANDRLTEIHLFIEEPLGLDQLLTTYPLLNSAKFRLMAHGRRLTYQDLFAYANRCLPGRCVIIANADMYFDHTLARLDGYDLAGRLLCLSRWDVRPDGSAAFFDHPASQDAWIFETPIREFPCNFHLGVLGCDNRLAWEAEHAGLAISNPSRTVRAYHLHLSHVRHSSERQRLLGPTRSVPAEFLGTPWLWFVVPCMGRLDDLRRTIGSLLSQTRSSYLLVDYSCPDAAGAWARQQYPNVSVATVAGRARFRGAEARNQGTAAVDDDGIICFLDADIRVAQGFSDSILTQIEEGVFLVPDRCGPGFDSTLVCRKTDFDRVHGFDEAFLDWGEECADLRAALHRSGLAERSFPATLLSPLGHHHATAHSLRMVQDQETNRAIHAAYRRAKAAILDETGANSISTRTRREIYSAIARRHLSARGLVPDIPCAGVAFRETMGYTIARLKIGVSSHNNDPRPFTAIPESLAGMLFTQVVASVVSPVEVEFLTTGKLYVLVGNDWDGSSSATAWLGQTGFREGLPVLTTRRGTGFEVWSLVGEAGERFVLPTQVMLVADHLVKV